MPGPTQLQGTSTPYQIKVGPPGAGIGIDITSKVQWDTIEAEEVGNHDSATFRCRIMDKALAYTAMRGEWGILYSHSGVDIFRGTITSTRPEMQVIHADIEVNAVDMTTLLDRTVITAAGTRRTNSETDKARIGWLFSQAWAQPLAAYGFDFATKVQVLQATMPDQSFPAGMTLRQALERILGGASESSDYYIDGKARLHTFDDSNPESGVTSPWRVNLTPLPAAAEVAPEEFTFEWDSTKRRSGLYVKGRNSAGSGYVTDETLGMASPYSAVLYGRADDMVSAPDADTAAKRNRYAKAVLRDVRNPIPTGSFTVQEPYITNAGTRWQGGQTVYITSTEHGLNGTGADAGPWAGNSSLALQPFRITRITTTIVNGAGDRRMVIELGGRRRITYGG